MVCVLAQRARVLSTNSKLLHQVAILVLTVMDTGQSACLCIIQHRVKDVAWEDILSGIPLVQSASCVHRGRIQTRQGLQHAKPAQLVNILFQLAQVIALTAQSARQDNTPYVAMP